MLDNGFARRCDLVVRSGLREAVVAIARSVREAAAVVRIGDELARVLLRLRAEVDGVRLRCGWR